MFISLYKVHFARVCRHEKVLALFVTSWPMLFVAAFILLRKYILLEFPGMRRFWHYLLPHGRCYLLQHLFHCITVHFAQASRHEKVLAVFITPWPMLFIATFISLHKVHLLEFPGMRSFWHYLLPHDRCFSLQRLFYCIKYILLEFPGMRRFWHYLLPHGRCYSLQHLFHCTKYILLGFPGMRRFWIICFLMTDVIVVTSI